MSIKAPYGFRLCTVPVTTDPIPSCPWMPATALRWLRTSLACSWSTSTNFRGTSNSIISSPGDFYRENRQKGKSFELLAKLLILIREKIKDINEAMNNKRKYMFTQNNLHQNLLTHISSIIDSIGRSIFTSLCHQ